jgi:hypothetical protein
MRNIIWLALIGISASPGCEAVHGTTADASAIDGGDLDASAQAIDAEAAIDAAMGCTMEEAAPGPAEMAGGYGCGDLSAPCENPDPAAAQYILIQGLVSEDARPDVLAIELYAGYGVFAGGFAVGSYSLAEESELDYATCGACLRVMTDVDLETSARVHDYFQTGGTLEITSMTPGVAGPATVSASVRGLTLTHVTIDGINMTLVGDCSTAIDDFDFTAALTDLADS